MTERRRFRLPGNSYWWATGVYVAGAAYVIYALLTTNNDRTQFLKALEQARAEQYVCTQTARAVAIRRKGRLVAGVTAPHAQLEADIERMIEACGDPESRAQIRSGE